MKEFIISLDQGTTSSRAIIFDKSGRIINTCQKEFPQIYPQPGWVEHNSEDIWNSQYQVTESVMEKEGLSWNQIAAIGITNQRETTIVWDKKSGKPIHNAIVWQCRRTAPLCKELKERGWGEKFQAKTGLLPDAYFSGTKLKWLLDNVEGARKRAENGELLFGTVDTWLLWKLSHGKIHSTDYTNASRTLLFNIHTLEWDREILNELNIPEAMLPQVKNSSEVYGEVDIGGATTPVAGIAGDQQAALFGQACFEEGDIKNTYGTGCFLLMNTGETPSSSEKGLLTTIAVGIDNKIQYALEGSVFIGGAVVQWLRDEMKLIEKSSDSEALCKKVEGTGGVYMVPAFTGLGSPYWNMQARGTIVGLTRGSNRYHLIRAAVESTAYQSRDLIDTMREEAKIPITTIKVDGGAARDNFLMQFQADITGTSVLRPQVVETTALGSAFLAGLAVGFWRDRSELKELWKAEREFSPNLSKEERGRLYKGWQKAVSRAVDWEE